MKDDTFKETLERMMRKGGECSFSLVHGSHVHVKGEERQTIMDPVEGAEEYFESKKPTKVIYL